MPYPPAFDASLAALEASRSARLKQNISRLSPAVKQALLESYHPDFRPAASCLLRVGVNAGDGASRELVALLESPARREPDAFDLQPVDYEVDVLVIGAGGTGSAAALTAHQNGASVLLITKLRHGDSNTYGRRRHCRRPSPIP